MDARAKTGFISIGNMIAVRPYVAIAEAIVITRRFGLIRASSSLLSVPSRGKVFILEVAMKGHVLEQKFAAGFPLGLVAKNVKIAAEPGETVKLDAPPRSVRDCCELAPDGFGCGADDNEAIKG